MANVVWILGAGFSVPLGGPTLASLFSAHAYAHLEAVYHSGDGPLGDARRVVLGAAATIARRLYLAGSRDDHGAITAADRRENRRATFAGMWGDAEDFLDTLETAALAPDGALSRRLKRVADRLMSPGNAPPIPEIRDAARRMLAIECSSFLLEASPDSERWEPYRVWRDELMSDANVHTVVTFNYDLVLETLGFQNWVTLPHAATGEASCLLKLHGSVNWKKGLNGERISIESDPHFVATCTDEQLAIAPPGPSKATIVKEEFEELWKLAERRLQQATAVFFVGYRFPPTDSTARRRILRAIPSSGCGLNIVLGPADPHGDVARLCGLLKFQAPNHSATVHRMWAQDFLGVCPTGLFSE